MGGNQATVHTPRTSQDDEESLRYKTARLTREIERLKLQTQDPHVEWLNSILSHLWPHISLYAARTMKESVEPRIQAALPSVLAGGFSFDNVTLGDAPLQLGSITTAAEDYLREDGMERDLILKFNTTYRSDALITFSAAGTNLGVQEIQLEGVLTVVLHELLGEPPFISGMSVFFANSPSVKMAWTGTPSVLYLLKHTVRSIIYQQMHDLCVLPKRISMVFDKSKTLSYQVKATCPPGCLHVRLLAARGLNEKNWHFFAETSCSPYAKLRVSGHEHRSKTLTGTCNPRWDEDFFFFAYTQEQQLCIDILNEDSATGDDFIGCLKISAANILARCGNGPEWFILTPDEEVDPAAKVEGEVQLMARLMPIFLDPARANAIETPTLVPQALLFLGLYSIRVPPALVDTVYTIEVSCDAKRSKMERKASGTEEVDIVDLKDKIAKLRSLEASDADIADILSIPVDALEDEDPSAATYANKIRVEEPFLWLVDVPKLTAVEIVVSDSNGNLFSVQHYVRDCLQESSCARRETIKSGKIKIDVFTKVLVIGS